MTYGLLMIIKYDFINPRSCQLNIQGNDMSILSQDIDCIEYNNLIYKEWQISELI